MININSLKIKIIMKNSNLKNGQKLGREAQKNIVGGDKVLPCVTGCVNFYLSDGQGRCVVPPCNTNYGTEVQVNGRWQCCF